jgi:DNA-binding IclR family transcriptional regulator
MPKEEVGKLAQAGGLPGLTKKSVTDLPSLMKQLALVRKRGYALDDEETRDGMMCFGAPIFDSRSAQAVAGLGVSMLKAATDVRQKNLAITSIREMAAEFSRRLGARSLSMDRPVF